MSPKKKIALVFIFSGLISAIALNLVLAVLAPSALIAGLAERPFFSSQSNKNDMTKTQINWRNPNQKISELFIVGEVTKGDARRIPQSGGDIERNILQLALELDKIRFEWGSPILVNSWYRPPAVNRAVGGSPNSQHLYGRAADIRPVDPGRLVKFQAWLDQHWYGGLGYGAARGFVHLDMRNNKGWRASGQKGPRWNY
jgi:putative chitinase